MTPEMNRQFRFCLIVLAIGAGLSWAVLLHLQAGDKQGFAQARDHLDAFPMRLTTPPEEEGKNSHQWKGYDTPLDEITAMKVADFSDEQIRRAYQLQSQGVVANLYLVHSHIGKERFHHPEICVREVAALPEDESQRKVVHLDSTEQRPVQRFVFKPRSSPGVVYYYWHYTFPLKGEGQLNALQRRYQLCRQRPPSLTVQVTTLNVKENRELIEKSFLPGVDQLLRQKIVPSGARMGCDRITVIPYRF